MRGTIHARVDAAAKLDSLRPHLIETPVQNPLFQLEFRDSIAKETAGTVGFLKDGDAVPGARELLRGCQAGGSGTDNGDAPASVLARGFGSDPTLLEGVLNDAFFNELNSIRALVD